MNPNAAPADAIREPAWKSLASASAVQPTLLEPPGGFLVWLIVVLEIVTFGLGLVVFAVQRSQEPAVFQAGQALLDHRIAFVNTLVLLTGGWLMAGAVARLRQGESLRAAGGVLAAALTGVAFLGLKGFEYADKLRHGCDLHRDTFFTIYWLLTGFHFLHVAVAVVLLLAMWRGIRRGDYMAGRCEDVEACGVFWHLCDLIWLLLVPVLYLLR